MYQLLLSYVAAPTAILAYSLTLIPRLVLAFFQCLPCNVDFLYFAPKHTYAHPMNSSIPAESKLLAFRVILVSQPVLSLLHVNLSLPQPSFFNYCSLNSPYTMLHCTGPSPFPYVLNFCLSKFHLQFRSQIQCPSCIKSFLTTVRNLEIREVLCCIWLISSMTAALWFSLYGPYLPFKIHCKSLRDKDGFCCCRFLMPQIPQCFFTRQVLRRYSLVCFKIGFCT